MAEMGTEWSHVNHVVFLSFGALIDKTRKLFIVLEKFPTHPNPTVCLELMITAY